MAKARYLRRLGMVLAFGAMGGCHYYVYKDAPDPDASRFVSVVQVEGATLKLADGRAVQLAGVDLESLSPEERDRLGRSIQMMIATSKGVLIYPVDATRKARVEVAIPASIRMYTASYRQLEVGTPITRVVPPKHDDVGLRLVSSGAVPAKPTDFADPNWRQAYLDAQEHARRTSSSRPRTE